MKRTILIVDDTETIRNLLKLTLQFKGYNVLEAEDGKQALGILRNTPCDLLITDIAMPNMSGLELLNRVREELGNQTMPIIVCTAEAQATEGDILRRGANKLLLKPCPPLELIEAVHGLLG